MTTNVPHAHEHPHDHEHQAVPSDLTVRVKALESLLVEKGLVDRGALDCASRGGQAMNGIHDMGGMQDMVRSNMRRTSPCFTRSGSRGRRWNLDAFGHTREVLPPTEYLTASYYEQWFSGLLDLLVRRGLVTAAEIQSGVPGAGTAKATPPLTADKIPATLARPVLFLRSL